MNITYVIGNGFDLNLGLPTDYFHFYEYYCKQSSASDTIQRLKDNINQYINSNWVDLEIGLGKYTSKVSSADEFAEAYLDLNNHIIRYMSAVDDLADSILSDGLKDKIITDLLYPELALRSEYGRIITDVKQANQITPILNIRVDILSFNYTLTLEKLKIAQEFKTKKTDLLSCSFGGTTHIHRTIKDRGVWLGVDNGAQIEKDSLRNDMLIRQLLVKPYDISSFGNALFSGVERIINSSDLICVFGSSMGVTDSSWWRIIGKHMISSECKLLYITIDKKGFESDHMLLFAQNKIRSQIIRKLLGPVLTKEGELNNSEKILVPINCDIFKDKDYSSSMDKNFERVLKMLEPQKN